MRSIYQGGEDKAYRTYCEIRWADTDGEPVCPKCGCLEAYEIKSRRKFECKACKHHYSVTSGTIFASRKMAFVDLLAAIAIVINGAKGISALQLSRDIDCQYKTAFVLAHKLREALASETHGYEPSGDVEVDGLHAGGHIRPANYAENRVDRRLAQYQTGTRRVVIAMRERKGRTLPFVVRHESDSVETIMEMVKPSSKLYADEAMHWDQLHAKFETYRINHTKPIQSMACARTRPKAISQGFAG